MRNAGLDEAQARIKIARKNSNILRYADDSTLMSEKVGLKLNIQETKIMSFSSITSWQIDGETVETVSDFTFLDSKITSDGDCSREIKRRLKKKKKTFAPWKKSYD